MKMFIYPSAERKMVIGWENIYTIITGYIWAIGRNSL